MSKIATIQNGNYNISEIKDDRKFEEFIDKIFQNRIKDDLLGTYDDTLLMPGVGEKGRDILLFKEKKSDGIIQCKLRNSGNLDKTSVAKEIIKFCLYSLIDSNLINDISSFNYYLICSTNFSSPAVGLLDNFNNNIVKETSLNKWIKEVILAYEEFNLLEFDKIIPDLTNILININIKFKNYNHINLWLNKYEHIVEEYFEIKHVVDEDLLHKSLKKLTSEEIKKNKQKQNLFISKYLGIAKKHLNKVPFIGHSVGFNNKPQNVTVTKLYVEPNLIAVERKEKEIKTTKTSDNTKKLKVNDILKKSKNVVILGDPGVGKSLLIKNIIINLISKKNTQGYQKYEGWIPIRIELRKYNAVKLKHNLNINGYITSLFRNEYQLSDIKEEFITDLLGNNNFLIFFDGLDEVFDKVQKNNIRDDIINFMEVHKHSKCIVTSRFVGYDDNPFPEDSFYEFSIMNFTNKQIEKFVSNFYSIIINNKINRENNIKSLLIQLDNIEQQLKSNPLILSLISILALNTSNIPESKLDIYKACTETLVNTRDIDEKGLEIKLKVRDRNGIFGFLGYWQYCKMTEDKKLNRQQIMYAIADHLISRNEYSEFSIASDAADDFLNYAESRSIYFDNHFMHKTFLEYYAATYILFKYHNGQRIDERDQIIESYVDNISWHIVFELLFVMIDKQVCDDYILGGIVNNMLNNIRTSRKLLFLTKIFPKLNNINDEIRFNILNSVIDHIVSIDYDKIYTDDKTQVNILVHELKDTLLKDNRIEEVLKKILLNKEEALESDKSLIILYSVFHELGSFEYTKKDKLKSLVKEDLCLYTYYNPNWLSTECLIEQARLFGVGSLFTGAKIPFLGNTTWISAIDMYLSNSDFTDYDKLLNDFEILGELGLTEEFVKNKYSGNLFRLDEKTDLDSKIFEICRCFIKSDNNLLTEYLKRILNRISKIRLKRIIDDENIYNGIISLL